MNEVTLPQIMGDLEGMLRNFNGREYGGPITAHTLLGAELGLASIDAVVLGETIELHYQRKLPFGQFLAEIGRRGARDIEVGALAEFLHQHLQETDKVDACHGLP